MNIVPSRPGGGSKGRYGQCPVKDSPNDAPASFGLDAFRLSNAIFCGGGWMVPMVMVLQLPLVRRMS
jgi:hypothetical protein